MNYPNWQIHQSFLISRLGLPKSNHIYMNHVWTFGSQNYICCHCRESLGFGFVSCSMHWDKAILHLDAKSDPGSRCLDTLKGVTVPQSSSQVLKGNDPYHLHTAFPMLKLGLAGTHAGTCFPPLQNGTLQLSMVPHKTSGRLICWNIVSCIYLANR